MPRLRFLLLLSLAALLSLHPGRAPAQEPRQEPADEPSPARLTASAETPTPGSPDDQAQELSDQGVMAYRTGRLDEAIRLFKRAHTLRADPILLYNLARIYEKTGNPGEALEYYRRYLVADDTDPKLRARAETRVAELSRSTGKDKAAPPPPPGRRLLLTGVGLAAAGVAVVAVGIGLDAAGFSDVGQFRSTVDEGDKRALGTTARGLGIGAVVCYVTGAALLAGGGTLIGLGIKKSHKKEGPTGVPVRAALLPTSLSGGPGASVLVAGRF